MNGKILDALSASSRQLQSPISLLPVPLIAARPFPGLPGVFRPSATGCHILEPVVAVEPVEQHRSKPAGDENADDEIAQRAEIVVEACDQISDAAGESKPVGKEPERFHGADDHRDYHR